MTRNALAGAVAAAVLSVAGSAAAKPPSGSWKLETFRVDTTYGIPPGELGPPECSAEGDPAPCWLTLSGTDEVMRGTFEATGHWTGRVWLDETPDGNLSFDGVNFMAGTIEGCGGGTFEYHDRNGTLFTSRPDPLTLSYPAENDWVIPRSSTTGELADRFVSGRGRQEWDSYPFNHDRAQKNWATGHITGTVTCWVPDDRARYRRPKARRVRAASQSR